jgi:hypothetical protein
MSETPIEDYLDELLRRTRADARTTRRLLEEASDHLRRPNWKPAVCPGRTPRPKRSADSGP